MKHIIQEEGGEMKLKNLTLLGAFFLSGVISGCPKEKITTFSVYVQNNSQLIIKPYINSRAGVELQYPDTSLAQWKPEGVNLYPQNKNILVSSRPGFRENIFQARGVDTISFVIFDIDTLSKYPWEIIRQQYNILQRYDLSLQDL